MTDRSGKFQFNASLFLDHMSGGAFICRATKGYELLYANENIIHLFDCDDYEDLYQFTGGSYEGMVTPAQLSAILKEMDLQILEQKKSRGHLFYHIKTKKGNLHLVEEHWSLEEDETWGPLFYVFIVSREFDNSGSDYDPVTGLYGKSRFQKYVTGKSKREDGERKEYAVAYLNFVNFKLLNINQGIAEGDACLRTIADILSVVFEDAFLARLSDDHFAIFAEYDGIVDRMEEFNRQFHDCYGSRYDVIGKCGIYHYVPSASFDMEEALSYAKVACDFIKYDSKLDIVEYSTNLAKQVKTSEHVIRKLDEALEKEWIKVYYQPVVRAITGQLCGMESLVRWKDPELGFILPNEFIKTLEDNRQIHKLDCYVVEKVCQCIQDRVQRRLPAVPVSVNFSRLDFAMCDMLQVVEQAVEKYDVPRDYIHIEITESMIASDEELMRGVIADFRKAGYEIWMDDFGSGYSSLTLLKDYQFDMLKLDMNFLSSLTERAKDILRSTITMAKNLGIKTLAEGVETQEQLDYLKEIGCGEIQGYYYGRPEPIDELFLHLKEKNVTVEMRRWRHFYSVASLHVRATEMPLEIIEDDGKSFRTLFMNRAYREQIFDRELSLEEIDRRTYQTASPLLEKYREFAEQLKKSKQQETFYYTDNGNYLCLWAKALVQQGGHAIISASLFNITMDPNVKDQERLDSKLREINHLFEVVLLANVERRTLEPLLGSNRYADYQNVMQGDIAASNEAFIRNYLDPSERKRYIELIDFTTIRQRIESCGKGYVTDIFHIKQRDGSFRPGEVTIMMIPGTEAKEYLYCMKAIPVPAEENRPKEPATSEEFQKILWKNMLQSSTVKFFWKDRERRFLGASQAFLDYYGMDSLDEILGKTDEEMNWHVDDGPYRGDEIGILQKGEKVYDALGQCIVKGEIRNIACNKLPIYDHGEIVGLMGYFVDQNVKNPRVQERERRLRRDSITDLLNARALVESMVDYAMQYHNQGRNYGLIVLRNSKHSRILSTYDEKFGGTVLKEMGKVLVAEAGSSGVIARTKDAVFVILTFVRKPEEIYELAERIREKLEAINEVEGNPVTMRIRMSVKIRTEDRITDENMYEMALQEITENL